MRQIEPIFARSDKPNFSARFAPDPPVHFIGVRKRLGRLPLVIYQTEFLIMRCVAEANTQPTLGHCNCGVAKIKPVRIAIDHRCRLDCILHRLEPNPDPGKPRQRITV